MTPRWTSPLTGSQVYEADARLVAATLPPGCASLAILDGPYGLQKAAWDRIPRGGTLADLYQGHLDDVGRVCAASASLYLWNTSAGWAELHPHILARGWMFRSLIVWDKQIPPLTPPKDRWIDTTEVCGMYHRGTPIFEQAPHNPRRAGGEHIRPITTIWTLASGAYHSERLKGDEVTNRNGSTCLEQIHPCQKPLIFAERMIRASSRPGAVCWAPFGGTLREMVAAERMARLDPAEARKVVTCELNQDGGKDYIGAALEQIGAEVRPKGGQLGLFRAGR
jgi:DNA modification methylase